MPQTFCKKMKRNAIWISMMLIVLAGGIWFGFQWRNPPIQWDMPTFVTCGGGNYPKEAFRKVNNEIDGKIESLVGEHASRELFVAVIPDISGYRVRIAGNSSSKLFKEPMSSQLADWISQRMEEIQREEQEAEQASAGQPATQSRQAKE
jgi:hypothetical protein